MHSELSTADTEAGVMPAEQQLAEIRQIFEEDDFGEEFTPELREQERRLRERAEANARV